MPQNMWDPTLNNWCNRLSMLGLKLNNVCKRGTLDDMSWCVRSNSVHIFHKFANKWSERILTIRIMSLDIFWWFRIEAHKLLLECKRDSCVKWKGDAAISFSKTSPQICIYDNSIISNNDVCILQCINESSYIYFSVKMSIWYHFVALYCLLGNKLDVLVCFNKAFALSQQ